MCIHPTNVFKPLLCARHIARPQGHRSDPKWEDPGSLWERRTSRSTAVPVTSWRRVTGEPAECEDRKAEGGCSSLSQEETSSSETTVTVPGEGAAGGEARGEEEFKINVSRFRPRWA